MPDVDKVIAKYIELRDARSDLKRAYEAEDSKLKEQMERLEEWIKQKQREVGVTQFKGPSGIAFQQTKTRFQCVDWGRFHEWLLENNRLDLLEKRVAQRALAEWREETDSIPPGLNVYTEIEVVVRKG